ncbi:hypothetical protein GW17_00055403 [Ensete ventricosum]|nr:hypothetical protein GW17_00055403 [Ensete ventricosum]RZS23234.1 hypothetical protein BHM03_00056131 [Ensete ventricosum]
MGARQEFTKRFTEGIRKLDRNTPGDHWSKTVRLATRDFRGYWNAGVNRQLAVVQSVSPRISGGCQRLNRSYPGIWALSAVDPPKSLGIQFVPEFFKRLIGRTPALTVVNVLGKVDVRSLRTPISSYVKSAWSEGVHTILHL